MSGKTHIMGGAFLSTATLNVADQLIYRQKTSMAVTILFIGFSMIGALLSDVDHRNSIAGRALWFIFWPLYLIQTIVNVLLMLLPKRTFLRKETKRLQNKIGHRGIAHYPMNVLILLVLTMITMYGKPAYSPNYVSIAIFGIAIGVVSHLLLDFISGKIPLFGPFSDKRYGIQLVTSRSMIDKVFIRGMLTIGTMYMIIQFNSF